MPITDLAVKDDDLIAATQGRSFWILDGLSPLHGLSDAVAEAPFHLFPPAAAWRLRGGRSFRTPRFQGANPPAGAVVDFLLNDVPEETEVALEFTDAAGDVLRRFEGEVDFEKDDDGKAAGDEDTAADAKDDEKHGEDHGEGVDSTGMEEAPESADEEQDPAIGELELERGLNRFAWNLRAADAEEFEGIILWAGDTEGPMVPPGAYTVTLTVGEESVSADFELLKDPRSSASQSDLEEQYTFQIAIRDKLSEIHGAIEDIRKVRAQLGELKERLGEGDAATEIRESAKALDEAMGEVEKALYQTKNQSRQDPLNFPIRLNDKLGESPHWLRSGMRRRRASPTRCGTSCWQRSTQSWPS